MTPRKDWDYGDEMEQGLRGVCPLPLYGQAGSNPAISN